jgi:hypothetical protein
MISGRAKFRALFVEGINRERAGIAVYRTA